MHATKNNDRVLYVRFNIRIVYVAPLTKAEIPGAPLQNGQPLFGYAQRGKTPGSNPVMRLDAQCDTVDFYADKEKTKLVYSYIVP
jgi:hypothetical protein